MTPEQLAAARAGATRPRRTVPVVLDGDLRERIERVEAELGAAVEPPAGDRRLSSRSRKVDTTAAQATLDALTADAASKTLHVVLEAMPRTPYRQLIAEHPARKDDAGKTLDADDMGINIETFPPALIRACAIGHKPDPDGETIEPLDAEYVDWLVDEFCTDRQIERLWAAAYGANRGHDAIPLPQLRSTTQTAERA